MKAIINGVTVEGTPDEILEYQRLDAEQRHEKAKHKLYGGESYTWNPDNLPWWMLQKVEGNMICGIITASDIYDTK